MTRTTSRDSFTRSSGRAALESRGKGVSFAEASKIVRCADEVREKVKAHHAKHQDARTNKRYGELLAKHGQERAPMPSWAASEPQAKLMERARASVASSLQQRLDRVDRAQTNMLRSDGLRGTRSAHWARALRE